MFWVLKRSVSLRRFFLVPTTYVLFEKEGNIFVSHNVIPALFSNQKSIILEIISVRNSHLILVAPALAYVTWACKVSSVHFWLIVCPSTFTITIKICFLFNLIYIDSTFMGRPTPTSDFDELIQYFIFTK